MTLLTTLLGLLSCGGASYVDLNPDAFEAKMQEKSAILMDVRTPDEYNEGHLTGAVNVDWQGEGFLDKVEATFPKERALAVYCRSGRRSAEAAARLTTAGYTVFNLAGGYLAWTEAGKPVSAYEVEVFRAPDGEPVVFTLIKHGSLALTYKGMSFQFDPVTEHGKHTDYGVEFPKADVIFVTHEHGDHLDPQAIQSLTAEGVTTLVTNARCAEMLGKGTVMANGDSMTLPSGIRVDAVPAYNCTEGRTQFHPKGRDNGFILTLGGLRVYVAGDTEDIPEMESIKDIDIAFLPVNQPYTMTVEQCVHAAQVLRPKVLIPYHFSRTDLSELPALLPDMQVLLRQMQ